jgi:hypothetical protein
MMPEATSEAPRIRVSSAAARSGFSNVTKAGNDVEHTEQSPEQEFAPALDLEGAEYFGNAGDDHHNADDEDARDGGHHNAAKRDKPDDEIDGAQCDDPAPLGA